MPNIFDPATYTPKYCESRLRDGDPDGVLRLYLISQGRPVKHRFNKSLGGDITKLSRCGKAPQNNPIMGRI
jgi:hypothetical protein